jgi:hypothetical protein
MPETLPPQRLQLVALILVVSAITLIAVAYLIYAGVVPVPEEVRPLAAAAVGLAAIADLGVAFWFFRKGQSS